MEPVCRDNKYSVAYFSAEYGLHRSLPFYAGGLGFLAGDFIKECSDLCLPLVAVGFMYPDGYFRQQIRDDGWQENFVEAINRDAAPISRVMDTDGRQLVIQIIFAGKAHPADDPGKRVLQNLINLARDPDLGGMKAALNGVPHLSVLDGWWEEGFNDKNGWGIAHEETPGDPEDSDAQKIYRLLEEEIIPRYYSMSENSIPQEWVKLMKESMKSNAAEFSARRMVKQYVEKFYYKSIQRDSI